MRVHALLNLLKELSKEIKCEACRAFYAFFLQRDKASFRNKNTSFYKTKGRNLFKIKNGQFHTNCINVYWNIHLRRQNK